ncbi:MAG TPA: hypothetical protein PKN33_11365 [Phycisphaerae bacterium]|nr:hypothetical protein [Phycisphaerae bacterium]
MIEFKGECGHTIRARDEDSGRIVRCSYCGKEALVTRQAQDDLDVLFDQVEQTGSYDAQATRVGQKFHKAKARQEKRIAAGKPAQAFDPFDIAMKMTYVAVIIILIFVGVKYVPGLYETLTGGDSGETPIEQAEHTESDNNHQPAPQSRKGLLTESLNSQQEGVYVSSVPSGAGIYHLPKTSVTGSILDDPMANKNMRTNRSLRLNPGQHTIAVAIRINDSKLMNLEGYEDLRRKIEDNDPGRDRDVMEYFVPDGSVATRVEKLRGALHLVRVFECEVDSQTWESTTALFLPRSLGPKEIVDALPRQETFGYKDAEVQSELGFYQVSRTDMTYVETALKRVGVFSYKNADGTYRLFSIDPATGAVISRRINP